MTPFIILPFIVILSFIIWFIIFFTTLYNLIHEFNRVKRIYPIRGTPSELVENDRLYGEWCKADDFIKSIERSQYHE